MLVEVAVNSSKATVKDENGDVVPSQIRQEPDGKYYLVFRAENVPSMGYRTYTVKEGKTYVSNDINTVKITPTSLENDFYKAVLGNGGIVSLYDKKLGKIYPIHLSLPVEM